MNSRLQRKIEQAKKRIGLEDVTTQEAIIDRINSLRIETESNPSHRMWAKRREIEKAGLFLLKHFDRITGYVSEWNHIDPIAYFISEEEAVRVRKIEKIKVLSVLAVLLLMVGIYLADAIPDNIQANREFLRSAVLLYRTNLNVTNVEALEDYLDKVEDNSDIIAFKEEYATIREQVHIWATGDIYIDHDEMRAAYYHLLAFDQANQHWNLSRFLPLYGRILPLILGARFEANGMFFEIRVLNAAAKTIEIVTSLPTNALPGATYVAEPNYNWHEFSMRNVGDSANQFVAFRINLVTETEIRVYAYATQTIYTLTFVDPV